MSALLLFSALAIQEVVSGACGAVGLAGVEGAGEGVVRFLTERFTDQSVRLTAALRKANRSAWRAVEVTLAGDSLWAKCTTALARGEDKAFGKQVRTFLDALPANDLPDARPAFRAACLKELKAARKANMLDGGALEPKVLAQAAGPLARFGSPEGVLEAQADALGRVAEGFPPDEFPNLHRFLTLRPKDGPPIFAAAARYFFRRAVEGDEELARGLAFARMESLGERQEAGFAALSTALDENGQRLGDLLGEVLEVAAETRSAVLDVRAEQGRQGSQLAEMYEAVIALKDRLSQAGPNLRPQDSLSIRSDAERRSVRLLLERFRALPESRQREMPALLNGLGMLEVAAGEFEPAQKLFQEVAANVTDQSAEAEAHHNAYRAALERRDWSAALDALRRAVRLDAARLEPFPFERYEPQQILGAGGFGTAFLCRHARLNSRVVVKTLNPVELQQDVDELFREARTLEELNHAGIIRVRDADFADDARSRPFLVMDYFDGVDLEEHVRRHGVLPPERATELARQLAEAIAAAHAQGLLHRDVKPSNVLVRQEGAALKIKLIDFGLALRQGALRPASVGSKSLLGSSIAGTLDYAAPEQMGRLEGVAVGTYSDIYGLGKTCCYALFKTTQPLMRHWKAVPESLADLLNACLAEAPADRPAEMAAVLARLGGTAPSAASAAPMKADKAALPPLPTIPRQVDVPPVGPPRLPPTSQPPPGSRPLLQRQGEGQFFWTGPYERIAQLATMAIAQAGFTLQPSDPAMGAIQARSGMTWRSFGENITICLNRAPGGIRVLITSSLMIGTVGWGKDGDNVRQIADALERLAAQ